MEKLQIALSELKLNCKCISPEIQETECLSIKVSKSIETYQASIVEIQKKTQEISNLKQEEQDLITKIKGQENEFHLSMDKLENLYNEYEGLSGFDEYKFGFFKNIDFQNQLKVFGITVDTEFVEPALVQIKILFSEDKFVVLNYNFIENSFDLQRFEPKHDRFDKMRIFLLESRDIGGFLYSVRTWT
ncbi:uncharacterized protein LOC129944313 isoform X3 [Eupeodes corollae]|uniref:uncharacterized protein LOC129944313 isoform X3 n=1 Tax=Eupeodes corollae TaxID=290404 RepID=UPI002493CB0B|nr:uncharacterized protein LOC129944313 isoform X3 [Eupeodes corollae]